MRIRTFRASTMTEALAMVKEELGPDAVILDNRQVRESNGATFFEVKAAVDFDIDRKTETKNTATVSSSTELKNIQYQISEIKNFLSLLVSTKDHLVNLYKHKKLAEVYNYLLMQGLDEKKVYLLLTKSAKLIGRDFENKNKIISAFCKQLINSVATVNPFENIGRNEKQPAVFSFIGPTGVGKTTTLAKVATRLKIGGNYKVGIISLDTYRIGAYEQIKTYAEIIDVPLMNAQNRDELEFAKRQLQECNVLLVDTVGRNFLVKNNIYELLEFFPDSMKVNHFLVLSATSKDDDLSRLIRLFAPFEIKGLIFTKLDETLTYGNIINQLLRFPYPVAFFCSGQKVPEDIEEASERSIIRLVFPSKRNKYIQ